MYAWGRMLGIGNGTGEGCDEGHADDNETASGTRTFTVVVVGIPRTSVSTASRQLQQVAKEWSCMPSGEF